MGRHRLFPLRGIRLLRDEETAPRVGWQTDFHLRSRERDGGVQHAYSIRVQARGSLQNQVAAGTESEQDHIRRVVGANVTNGLDNIVDPRDGVDAKLGVNIGAVPYTAPVKPDAAEAVCGEETAEVNPESP